MKNKFHNSSKKRFVPGGANLFLEGEFDKYYGAWD